MEQVEVTEIKNPSRRTLPEAAKKFMFKTGQSGNPAGRPKGIMLATTLRNMLEEICPDEKANGKTWRALLVEATVRHAIKGNSAALAIVWERLDGKIRQDVKVEVGAKPILDLSTVPEEKLLAVRKAIEEAYASSIPILPEVKPE